MTKSQNRKLICVTLSTARLEHSITKGKPLLYCVWSISAPISVSITDIVPIGIDFRPNAAVYHYGFCYTLD